MANELNDLTVLELDIVRTLRYGRKALKMIEQLFDCKITNLNIGELSVDDIVKFIHCGLIHEDMELSLERLEELLDEYGVSFGTLINKLGEAFNWAFGVNSDPK